MRINRRAPQTLEDLSLGDHFVEKTFQYGILAPHLKRLYEGMTIEWHMHSRMHVCIMWNV